MKFLPVLLLSLPAAAQAALIAHMEVADRGTISINLQFEKAPRAVANFITLAQGTRSRVDPFTGAVTAAPLYVGETFYRTGNNSFSKFAQTGSGTGSNNGSVGFTFKDEFDPSLTHTGYTLSMANNGPNTNGGQIFLTGNIAIPSYDGVHTIAGLVTDPASRAVVDAVIAAGDNASTITAITFERTDPAAVAFDEHAQGLPTVTPATGKLAVEPGVSTTFALSPLGIPGYVYNTSRSTNLTDWVALPTTHVGIGRNGISVPVLFSLELDEAASPSAFYNIALAVHSDSVAPSNLVNRTITVSPDGGTYTFVFDSSGVGGSMTYTFAGGSMIGSPFTMLQFFSGAHHVIVVTDQPGITPRNLLLRIGCDSITSGIINCRQVTSVWNGSQWAPYPKGTGTITR